MLCHSPATHSLCNKASNFDTKQKKDPIERTAEWEELGLNS